MTTISGLNTSFTSLLKSNTTFPFQTTLQAGNFKASLPNVDARIFQPSQYMRGLPPKARLTSDAENLSQVLCEGFGVENVENCTSQAFKSISLPCANAFDRTQEECDLATLEEVSEPTDADYDCSKLNNMTDTQLGCVDAVLELGWDCFLIPGFNITQENGELLDFPGNMTLLDFLECPNETNAPSNSPTTSNQPTPPLDCAEPTIAPSINTIAPSIQPESNPGFGPTETEK